MAGGKLRLQIHTPVKTVLDNEVDYVHMHSKEGDFGILPGHAPFSAVLDVGLLRIYENRQVISEYAVLEGFATMCNDRLVVLSSLVERPDKIEAALENIAKEREENRALEQRAELEINRIESALRRVLVKSDVSVHSILQGSESAEDKDEKAK